MLVWEVFMKSRLDGRAKACKSLLSGESKNASIVLYNLLYICVSHFWSYYGYLKVMHLLKLQPNIRVFQAKIA